MQEQNFRIELVCGGFVLLMGLIMHITRIEFLILLLSIVLVLAAKMINTSIERLTDIHSAKHKMPSARLAKDIAAGMVLLFVFNAIVQGLLIFVIGF